MTFCNYLSRRHSKIEEKFKRSIEKNEFISNSKTGTRGIIASLHSKIGKRGLLAKQKLEREGYVQL